MDQREASKKDYGLYCEPASVHQINSGCLQRIADAVEEIAKNKHELEEEIDRYKRWFEDEQNYCIKLEHRCSAYKGIIKKMKGCK